MRPPSLLSRTSITVKDIVTGVLVTIGAHVLFPTVLAVIATLFTAAGIIVSEEEARAAQPPPPEELEHIQASLVKLGTQLDPRRLPDRPAPQTASELHRPNKFSKRNQFAERPDSGVQQPDSINDLMRRLGDRAEEFDSLERAREIEGHEQGVADGDPNAEPNALELWVTRMTAFFRRGWVLPTTISDSEQASLTLSVNVRINQDLTVASATVQGSSGNAAFDQSVRSHVDRIVSGRLRVPEPAIEIEEIAFNRTHLVRFNGRNARRARDESDVPSVGDTTPPATAMEAAPPPSAPPPAAGGEGG